MEQKPNTITDIIKPELPNLTAILSLSNTNNESVATIALQELSYLEQHALQNPWILQVAQVAPQSITLAIKSTLRKNLSLDPSAGLVYLKKRNLKITENGREKWVTVLEAQDTVNGIISYNRQLGRLLDYTNPKVIKGDSGQVVSVSVELLKPSYPQPRWETYEYDESDFQRWRAYSHRENKKGYKPDAGKPVPDDVTCNYANALYTSWKGGIDPEFARAKCLRHSLKKLGSNSNEGLMPLPVQNGKGPVIDADMAFAEAEEDNLHDFTAHEEVASTIKQQHNNANQPTQQSTPINNRDILDDL